MAALPGLAAEAPTMLRTRKWLPTIAVASVLTFSAPALPQTFEETAWMDAIAEALELDDDADRIAALEAVVSDVEREAGPRSAQFAEASAQLGIELWRQENYSASIEPLERSAVAYEAALGGRHETVAMAWSTLGVAHFIYAGDEYTPEAERFSRRGYEIRQLLPASPERYDNAVRLAMVLLARGDVAAIREARALVREAIPAFAGYAETHSYNFGWALDTLADIEAAHPDSADTIAVLEAAAPHIASHEMLAGFEERRLERLEALHRNAGRSEDADRYAARLANWRATHVPAVEEFIDELLEELNAAVVEPIT